MTKDLPKTFEYLLLNTVSGVRATMTEGTYKQWGEV